MSKQENEIRNLLNILGYEFQEQVRLSKITGNLMYNSIIADFYLPEQKILIEIQGIQHYKPSGFGKTKIETLKQFNRQMNRDSKLKNVCHRYNIKYREIAYNENITIKLLQERLNV